MLLIPIAQLVLARFVCGDSTRVVAVGRDGLSFSPAKVSAEVGDLVQFQFYPGNFSVVQSSYDSPCERLLTIPVDAAPSRGFYSGFMPTAAASNTIATYTVLINDTSPIYVACSQENYCPLGMVMTINAPSTGETYESFRSVAMASNVTSYGSTSIISNASTSIDINSKIAQSTELPSLAWRVTSEYKAVLLASLSCLVLIL